jgi:glycosyltransferase involved in cell wall biosynthesis
MEEKLSDSSQILERLEEIKVGRDVPAAEPLVSIIIPAYNISEFITETLDSVFAQTFRNFEVIIVNDGSPDTKDLEKVLAPYADRIIYGRQENCGASMARNAAICLSRGELIAFLDGDDFWFPNCLEKQVKFIEEKKLDMVYCDAELFGNNFLNGKTYMETTPSNGLVTTVSLIDGSCNVITSGTMVRRKKLVEVHLFDSGSARAQDFDLWFRLAKHGAKIDYQRDILIKYRVSPISLSGSNVERAERNVKILNFIGNKYDLTSAEEEVLKNQITFSEAELELEKGKHNLINGNYSEARRNIAKANEYYRKPKLSLLRVLLKISPVLTIKLFKKFRPQEFSFIQPGQAQN